MIDTFMVLWNRDRRRKGAKLCLTFLLICISASLLLATLYIPQLISLPKRANFARDFINKTSATVQTDPTDQAQKVSLQGRARAVEIMPTSVVEPPCATGAVVGVLPIPQKNHVKHNVAKKTGKKAHQRRGAKSSSHKTSKDSSSLKVIPPPGSTLRSTGSTTGLVLKPTATQSIVVVVATPVSMPTATPSSATNVAATTTSTGKLAITGVTPVATATVESDTAKGRRASNASIPHLQNSGGGPVSDDTSSTANDASYAAMASNDASQAMQDLAGSCIRKAVLKQNLP